MHQILKIINEYLNTSFLDEDGNILNIELRKGTDFAKIDQIEMRYGMHIPFELRELLLFSNGISIFGIQILPIEAMEFFSYEKKISFHNWGNGDFDVINENGQIFFCNHSVEALTLISFSLSNWITDLIKEFENFGTLLHPMDYKFNKELQTGLYKKVMYDLK